MILTMALRSHNNPKVKSSLIITCIASLSPLLCAGQSKPPTLDPTYGMPIPKPAPETKRLPDAKWIWAKELKDDQTIELRKIFHLSHRPAFAALYVTADNYFHAKVNGYEVGHTETAVPFDDFVWATVHRYEVENLLQAGENVIQITGINAGGLAGAIARLEVDGKPVVLTGADWQVQENDKWAPARVLTEVNGQPWGEKLSGWPVPLQIVPGYLAHLPIEPVQVYWLSTNAPNWISNNAVMQKLENNGTHIHAQWQSGVPKPTLLIDFGKELTGRVELDSPSPLDVNVGTGESMEEAVNDPWRLGKASLHLGAKKEASPYSAFRYAALTFPGGDTAVDLNVNVDHLYYPVQYRGSFNCSDPLLTQIWYTGAYTAHLCMQQDIWDAPKRDRMRWMGDLHVSGEVINNAFLDTFLMEQTLKRLREDAQGGRPDSEGPQTHVNDIPGYSCAWVCGMADFYRHTGDMKFLKSEHNNLVSLLEFFRGEMDDNGLFANKIGKWPFVDWSPGFDKDTPLTRAATHMFFVKALNEAAFLFAQMGDQENSTKYADWAKQATETARTHLADANGTYSERRQENAMAIYSGTATPEQTVAIYNRVLNPQSPAWNETATPYYNNYVIFAMSQAGHTQDALDFVRKYWGSMLAQGATSMWEGYDPKWPKVDFHRHLNADDAEGYFVSLCHGWSAGPTNFLTERVLGVRSTGAGFSSCVIQPDLGDLQFAEGVVPTPHGDIKVRAETNRVTCDIPRGVDATLIWKGAKTRLTTGHKVIT